MYYCQPCICSAFKSSHCGLEGSGHTLNLAVSEAQTFRMVRQQSRSAIIWLFTAQEEKGRPKRKTSCYQNALEGKDT